MEFKRNFNTSPEFLSSLLENTSEGIIAFDMNFNIIFRNRRSSEIHGLVPGVESNRWQEFITVMDSEDINQISREDLPLFKAMSGQSVSDSYHVLRRKDLPSILVKYNANPMYDENAKQIGVILTVEDAEDLARSMARFKAVFDQSPLSIQILDKSGKTILVNKSFKILWGFSDDFVENFILKDYNILEDRNLHETGAVKDIKRAFTGEIVQVPEILYVPEKAGLAGRPRWVRGFLYPLFNQQKQVKELVIIHIDNTDKKSEELARSFIAELTSALITTIDHDKVINNVVDKAIPILADGCMVDLIGEFDISRIVSKHVCPQKQVLMNELMEKYPPTYDSPQPTARAMRTGKSELIENVDQDVIVQNCYNEEHARLITAIGVHSTMVVPLSIRGKTIGALNLVITSDRPKFSANDLKLGQEVARQASVAIENARLYKEANDAIQLRDDFISMASHELRTPITSMGLQIEVIRSLMDEMKTNPEAPEMMKKFIESTNGQLQRLTRLVDDMLDISRISSGKLSLHLKKINLCTILLSVVDRFQDQLRNSSYVVNVDCPDKIEISCDPDRIDQVITNFMTNAIRYGNKNPIHLTLSESEKEVIFSIKDKGRGIPASEHDRIFKRFERSHTSQDVNGLGLGLYINQQIVSEHGGRIELQSAPGEGSTFTVYLPKA